MRYSPHSTAFPELILLIALLPCLSQNEHWRGRVGIYWFCLKYMVCKRESRNVLQWEVPWIGVSSCASHSVPGTQPAQVNSVPRAPTSLPAFLEAHSGLKPVSPLTHSSLTSFWLLAWIMQCTVVGYRPCSALRMRQERGWWRWNWNSGGAKYIPTLAQDPLCDLRHGS